MNSIPTISVTGGFLFCSLLASLPATAQVTTDGTTSTTVNADGNNFEINDGDRAGSNLFHSFRDFSVRNGGEAFFNNANDIVNIFSRVTGGNISNIDGLLRANGGANLFLINPAGIIFGNNARLDIGGSFYGTSADSILFEDGEFSATDLDNPPLLTINAPIGLNFRDNPGNITNNSVANDGRGLEVATGNNLTLLGGNVNFNGGRATAPGGIINLGGLSTAGTITINADNSLSFSDRILRSNISLSDNAVIDVTSNGGGLISVNANNLNLNQGSLFLANIGEGLGTENSVAGTINLNTNAIIGDGGSLISSDNLGIGQAGTININTDTLNLTNGAAITATTFGIGDAGTINVTARDITLDREFTGIYSNVGLTNIASEEQNVDGVVGNGGVININTDTLSLTNGARINSSSIAQGNGGNVNINATGAVSYIGGGETPVPAFGGGTVISGSFSQVQQDGVGNAGEVNITADSLTLIDRGAVLTDNSGVGGDAGNINLTIQNRTLLDEGALVLAQVQEGAVGNGGDINIQTGSLEARGSSLILADTKGTGDAGNISIQADESILLDNNSLNPNFSSGNNTLILAEVGQNAIGNAGDINISANSLTVQNGAGIIAQTQGEGDAGNIAINTQDNLLISNGSQILSQVNENATGNAGRIAINSNNSISLENGAGIFSQVNNNPTGNGGDIFLTTGELNLSNQTRILANTSGRSPNTDNLSTAGNINIDVSGDINLDNGNQIQSQVLGEAVGIAGDITINTGGSLFSTNGNLILADSQATGNGGNINITAGEQIVLEGFQSMGFPSQIVVGLTEDANGTGGNITISASELVLSDVAFIAANNTSTSTGAAGNITINVDRLQLTENAFINATTNNNSLGGSIDITAQTLDLSSGGKIAAATSGGGDAGNINLNVSDRIAIDNNVESSARFVDFGTESQLLNDLQAEGSGIFANATETATGNAGNITIGSLPNQSPEELIISNDAQIVVNSQGTRSGGSIFIRSENIELNNNASISASTEAIRGGEITLNIADNLVLENNSSISAEAGSNADGGNINGGNINGGNINIDTNFIVAFPNQNNDIIADAQQGNGGNINITAEAVFNIEERPLNDFTNDINASSALGAQFDGNVAITIPDINAIQTETQVPNNLIESQQTTEQACQSDRINAAKNGLNILGKGGIPPEAIEPLQADNIIIDSKFAANYIPPEIEPIETDNGDIYPARGIIKTADGGIILTAYPTENIPTRTPIIKPNCH